MSGTTTNQRLTDWVSEWAAVMQPADIYWCDGSADEYEHLCQQLVDSGTFTKLDEAKRPNSYWAHSDPGDVARVEDRTYICAANEVDAGPNNNWRDPAEMRAEMKRLYTGSMKGRTMYVVPFSMGPLGSPIAHIGVQLTDSAYVAANMRIMTRMGQGALDALGNNDWVPCLHSVGAPLADGATDVPWPCDAENKYIVHFPETREIWSYGSGYGGNALLGKKCFALRIASVMARDNGWLAEHMLILKLTNPEGESKYIAGAFPSACGKTNLAMLVPTIPGWKAETIGDDICWMKFGDDGRLYAINPEAGFFGVAPGTGWDTNYNAMETLWGNCIYTNTALTDDGDVWWEGMTDTAPARRPTGRAMPGIRRWRHRPPTRTLGSRHRPLSARRSLPNGRIRPECRSRRSSSVVAAAPLFPSSPRPTTGSTASSSARSWPRRPPQQRRVLSAQLRFDPMAMLPFCGYNYADYFAHWLSMEKATDPANLPKIFFVNWFRRDDDGRFLWPGYGENSRVLKWVFERVNGAADAIDTPIGKLPTKAALDTDGLEIDDADLDTLLAVDVDGWQAAIPQIREHYAAFGDRLPAALHVEVDTLEANLADA